MHSVTLLMTFWLSLNLSISKISANIDISILKMILFRHEFKTLFNNFLEVI